MQPLLETFVLRILIHLYSSHLLELQVKFLFVGKEGFLMGQKSSKITMQSLWNSLQTITMIHGS